MGGGTQQSPAEGLPLAGQALNGVRAGAWRQMGHVEAGIFHLRHRLGEARGARSEALPERSHQCYTTLQCGSKLSLFFNGMLCSSVIPPLGTSHFNDLAVAAVTGLTLLNTGLTTPCSLFVCGASFLGRAELGDHRVRAAGAISKLGVNLGDLGRLLPKHGGDVLQAHAAFGKARCLPDFDKRNQVSSYRAAYSHAIARSMPGRSAFSDSLGGAQVPESTAFRRR